LNTVPFSITVQILTRDRFDDAFALRLRALREHPEAFGQPFEEAAALTPAQRQTAWESKWNYRDNRVFVAIDGYGALVGMTGVVRQYRDKMRHRGEIWGVYVAPEARGQGVGSRLLEAAIAYVRDDLGLLQLHLEAISSNAEAVRSYERAGFVRYGRMPRADILNGTIYDSDLMVLMLDGYLYPPREGE
jgi:RimJ/RimL family protein N-acetyltransferase